MSIHNQMHNQHYTGKEPVWCLQQFTISLSTGTYLSIFFLLLWKRQISLLACHWSAVKKALDVGRFFSEKLNFFQLEKTLRAAEKDAGGGVLKSAQDFFENTVYSIGL